MQMKKTLLIVAMLCVLFMGGCGTLGPHVAKTAEIELDQDAVRQTLMVSMFIQNEQDENAGVLRAANDAANNAQLDTIGADAYNQVATMLAKDGFVLSTDPPQAKKLGESKMAKSNAAKAGGVWYHPDGATAQFTKVSINGDYSDTALTLRDQENLEEHFAQISITVGEGSGFAIGRIGRFYPIVYLRILILNNQGRAVYKTYLVGEGDKNFLVTDRSPANMKIAISRALRSRTQLDVDTMK